LYSKAPQDFVLLSELQTQIIKDQVRIKRGLAKAIDVKKVAFRKNPSERLL
jgi:hypothetical protein